VALPYSIGETFNVVKLPVGVHDGLLPRLNFAGKLIAKPKVKSLNP
jgi:hypothetical protein